MEAHGLRPSGQLMRGALLEAVRARPLRKPIVHTVGRPPPASTGWLPLRCGRDRSEQTSVYRLVQYHPTSVIAHSGASTGDAPPRFINDEADARLQCGILAPAFLRLRWDECGCDKLVALFDAVNGCNGGLDVARLQGVFIKATASKS